MNMRAVNSLPLPWLRYRLNAGATLGATDAKLG